jgi:hypothetical protein
LKKGLTIEDVSIAYPAVNTYAVSAASARDVDKRCRYEDNGGIVRDGVVPLTMKSYGRLGLPAVRFLSALADVAMSPVSAWLEVIKAAFYIGRHVCELSEALTRGTMWTATRRCICRSKWVEWQLVWWLCCSVVLR